MIKWIEANEKSLYKHFKHGKEARVEGVYLKLMDYVFLCNNNIILPNPVNSLTECDHYTKCITLINYKDNGYEFERFYPTHFALRSEYEAILPKEI